MIKIRNIIVGGGLPKICVPLTARNGAEMSAQAKLAVASGADICEFRADYFEGDSVAALPCLRSELGDMPLLFTFRTKAEGGEREIGRGEYFDMCVKAARSGLADILDTELSAGSEVCRELAGLSRGLGVSVILSSHDFKKTPPKPDMLKTLETARELGGDIAKLAVMPQTAQDVLALLEVTMEFTRKYPDYTAITMSMGALGKTSRVCGELTGSAVTFAALDKASAPGQLPVAEMRAALRLMTLK